MSGIDLGGWWCPACKNYNGEEKRKLATCRVCEGPRTIPEGLGRDALLKFLEVLVRERNLATEQLTIVQEKFTAYIEVARCAKAHVEAGCATGHALGAAVQRLEAGAGSAALLTPPAERKPYEPPKLTPLCKRCGEAMADDEREGCTTTSCLLRPGKAVQFRAEDVPFSVRIPNGVRLAEADVVALDPTALPYPTKP